MTSTVTTRVTQMVLPGMVEPSGLQARTEELPAPGAGQVVLRMAATGVSFAEQQMRRGKYYDQPPFPFVPGYDVVGTVTATGAGVDSALTGGRFAAGQFPLSEAAAALTLAESRTVVGKVILVPDN